MVSKLCLVVHRLFSVEVGVGQDLWGLVGFLLVHYLKHFLGPVVLVHDPGMSLRKLSSDRAFRNLRKD